MLLTVVCDRPLGEGEGERIVAQCFETDDVGTSRLVVLIGGVYSMRRDGRVCQFRRERRREQARLEISWVMNE